MLDTPTTNIPDTTHTIHVVDTTFHRTDVFDTIRHHVEVFDTVRPELLEVYQRLMNAQDDKFDYLLATIAIIVTALVLFVAIFNVSIARQLFKIDARKAFKHEAKNFQKEMSEQLSLLNRRINAETFKASSLTHISHKKWIPAARDLFKSVAIYSEIKDVDEIEMTLGGLEACLEQAVKDGKKVDKQKDNIDDWKKILEDLPNNLNKSQSTVNVINLLAQV